MKQDIWTIFLDKANDSKEDLIKIVMYLFFDINVILELRNMSCYSCCKSNMSYVAFYRTSLNRGVFYFLKKTQRY